MTHSQASQIAALINSRNQLMVDWSVEKILEHEKNWVYLEEADVIVACAEVKKVQWYHYEICHVSVGMDFEGKHLGSRILLLAEETAIISGAKILQCTIRADNERSQRLFLSKGYRHTVSFYNPKSGNEVNVYQKSVSKKPQLENKL
jgi:N-acetylglutamate synthase-like GNAT family acetyltransferase